LSITILPVKAGQGAQFSPLPLLRCGRAVHLMFVFDMYSCILSVCDGRVAKAIFMYL
jgi:hypothetical protein